jgi:hypothetical protein
MTDRVYTATNVCGSIILFYCNPMEDLSDSLGTASVTLEYPYHFIYSQGNILPFAEKRVRISDQMVNLPVNIQTALIDLQTYMKNEAFDQEGMT